MLDECSTVDEAQRLFLEMPNSGNPILLIADASGAAVIAEGYGRHKVVRPVENGWAVATNHFTAAETRTYSHPVMSHSLVRSRAAGEYLEARRGQVSAEGIKQLLGTKYPEGLCCHYYKEFFGTLHSMVFDLNERCVQVAFGSPAVNGWHTFRFGAEAPGEYESVLPLEQAGAEFWEPVLLTPA